MSGFSLFGVNLSGAEFNSSSTQGVDHDYSYPTHAEIDYFASKGMTAIRLPFLLERVQPLANGPLSASELSYIDDAVSYAGSKGIDVILDPHNYGVEHGTVIGSTAASIADFADFWGKFADHFSSTPNVLFDLMNEPNAVSAMQWIESANAAIDAIRAAGATSQQILVPGTDWDGAWSWVSSENASIVGAGVVDPAYNFAFEVHQYLDSDGSGTDSNVVSITVGVERLTDITAWAEATGNKLFLGEFGVASDTTSLTALNNMLSYMAKHADVWEGGTYWAAGAWLGSYMYSVEPTNGVDKPQMGVLEQYVPYNTIESFGSTALEQVENNYYLGASGPELKYDGSAVVVGHFGTCTSTPPATSSATIGSGSDQFRFAISEDAFNGDAQHTVWVDGTQIGGIHALHSSCQSDLRLVQGDWGSGSRDVAADFLNDAWSPGVGDQNLYIDEVTYNGADIANAKHTLLSGAAFHFDL